MSKADKIKELKELLADGSISQEEFEKLKKEVVEGKDEENASNEEGAKKPIEDRDNLHLTSWTNDAGKEIKPPEINGAINKMPSEKISELKRHVRSKINSGNDLTKDEEEISFYFGLINNKSAKEEKDRELDFIGFYDEDGSYNEAPVVRSKEGLKNEELKEKVRDFLNAKYGKESLTKDEDVYARLLKIYTTNNKVNNKVNNNIFLSILLYLFPLLALFLSFSDSWIWFIISFVALAIHGGVFEAVVGVDMHINNFFSNYPENNFVKTNKILAQIIFIGAAISIFFNGVNPNGSDSSQENATDQVIENNDGANGNGYESENESDTDWSPDHCDKCDWCGDQITGDSKYTHGGKLAGCQTIDCSERSIGSYCSRKCCSEARKDAAR